MNEGIHLDLDTWIVPGQIRKANLCRGYTYMDIIIIIIIEGLYMDISLHKYNILSQVSGLGLSRCLGPGV